MLQAVRRPEAALPADRLTGAVHQPTKMPYNTLQAMVAGGVDPRWADSDTNTRFHGRRVGPRSKQLPQRRSSQVGMRRRGMQRPAGGMLQLRRGGMQQRPLRRAEESYLWIDTGFQFWFLVSRTPGVPRAKL